ncbi:MAG: alkaline phosphatase family protein [Pyrinomonadaceae bacterium]
MTTHKTKILLPFIKFLFVFAFIFFLQTGGLAQNVKRVVIVKIDGLPGYYVDRFVKEKNPQTGKSLLPWFEEVFYKNGTRLDNFYVRGISLSAPSWSMLDTGQHLQIKGNVEYDRLTLFPYDYLDIVPYYVSYGLKKRADTGGVEVLDQLKIPLLSDAFDYQNRYTGYQLFQRGVEWEVLAGGFARYFPTNPKDLIDEWTLGFDLNNSTVDQSERDIAGKLGKNPEIEYFDYYSGWFDHVSHHNRDRESRFKVLKDLDGTLGRIWTAIQKSPQADETALFLVSDHGFNSDEKIYSQGFNIIKLLGSADGGGHHVVTQRRLMMDYSIKGVNPFVPLITTTSKDSYYLKGQSTDYPTALLDFDGNERASIHFRNSDLNILQILLRQMQNEKLSPDLKKAAANSFFDVINRRRAGWEQEIADLNEELAAFQRWIQARQEIVKTQPKKFTPADKAKGLDKEALRNSALGGLGIEQKDGYRQYIRILSNLLSLKPETFDAGKIKIEDYIAKGSMGDRNSVYQLQNYVVGLSDKGLTANADNKIDFEKSFKRINYFDFIESQKVLNNAQPAVSNQPVDFIAERISLDSLPADLPPELKSNEDAIWLYGGTEKQALILTREDADGNQSFRYLPIANLRQTSDGKISFDAKNWSAGFPLKIFEDENLNIPATDKLAWLNDWHTEIEWLDATHKTLYSNAIIGLNEQIDAHPLTGHENERKDLTADEKMMRHFRQHQRRLTEPDMLVLANNHWNFDVRGFNPGGNHGSFFRISTNSTLMAAGGAKTGIPRGLEIETPYDSLSFVPTVLALMGEVDEHGEPNSELYGRGFRKFPGRIVKEFFFRSQQGK